MSEFRSSGTTAEAAPTSSASVNSRVKQIRLLVPIAPARGLALAALAALLRLSAGAQTYVITDLGTLETNATFATGVNASGEVAGYSVPGTNAVRAWRYTAGLGLVDLGSFSGADTRALGLNDAGQVTGYSTDGNGVARGFIFSDGIGLVDLGGFGGGAAVFPQRINSVGQVTGFSFVSGQQVPFLFTAPGNFANLGTIPFASPPARAAAYGLNDAGQVVGVGSWQNGLNRAFRTGTHGAAMQELGTLGGDESAAYAINNTGQVVGAAQALTADSHAFRFTDGAGMTDLGTLGGFDSTAFALNAVGNVVGSAQTAALDPHAFVWSSSTGMKDLNDLIPANAGWVLTEARGLTDSGLIAGNGLLHGQPRAFRLTPFAGADTNPPVAALVAAEVTNVSVSAQSFKVVFWDYVSVASASIGSNSVRVAGPNGFNQLATFTGLTPTNNGVKLTATYYVLPPNGIWNGTNNGVYSVSVEPNSVHDLVGNFMPGGEIGTFRVATETTPVAGISGPFFATMGQATIFTLTARGSVPYSSNDVFPFTVDWNGNGSDLQTISGVSGTDVAHTFTSIGTHLVRVTATDPHGLTSPPAGWNANVVNPAPARVWEAAASLPSARHQAVGLNANGTLLVLGGLPVKGQALVDALPPGGSWAEVHRLADAAEGLGAGYDSLGRIVVFGGLLPNATMPTVNGYVYDTSSGPGAAIAPKHFAVHDLAVAADDQRRLYAIGGAGASGFPGFDGLGVERYDAHSDAWTVLAPLPSPRTKATAVYDGLGHVLVFGGINPTSFTVTTTVFSYDIASDAWSQLADVPAEFAGPVNDGAAVLGADGLVYLVGTGHSVFDPVLRVWFFAPLQLSVHGAPAVALGNDGFIYVMGGDNTVIHGGLLDFVERLDTASPAPALITSAANPTGRVDVAYSYQVVASGNPRPAFSLVSGPAGMSVSASNGVVTWTPAFDQLGTQFVTVRATNSVGVAEQFFNVNVHSFDITPPSAPTIFFVFARSATNLTFTWSAATDDVAVAHYRLWHIVGTRTRFWAVAVDNLTNRSVVYPAAGGTSYAVSAVDAAGNESPRSVAVFAATLTRPTIFHAIASESATVIVGNAFLYTLGASGSPPPTFSDFHGPADMNFSRTPGANPLNDYGVVQWMPTAGQVGTNFFTATATNTEGTRASATFSVAVLPAGTDLVPPTPVAQMVASGISFDRCTLGWTPAGDNIGVANYFIQATHFGAPGETNQVVTANVSGANTNALLTGLLASSGYSVSITPSDAAGNVGGSTAIFLTTLPQPLVNLSLAPGLAPGTLALNWNGYGLQWVFTVESADSLTTPNWTPVAPTNQWPNFDTSFIFTPAASAPLRSYRVNATPGQP